MAENNPKQKRRTPSWCAQLLNRLGVGLRTVCHLFRCAADNDRAHRGRVDKKSGNLYDHADLQGAGRPACRVPGRTGR